MGNIFLHIMVYFCVYKLFLHERKQKPVIFFFLKGCFCILASVTHSNDKNSLAKSFIFVVVQSLLGEISFRENVCAFQLTLLYILYITNGRLNKGRNYWFIYSHIYCRDNKFRADSQVIVKSIIQQN